MEKINNIALLEHSTAIYLSRFNNKARFFYSSILLMIMTGICSLPFCFVDITVRVRGITRPALERTEIRAGMPGTIERICYKEGAYVEKGDTILRMENQVDSARHLWHQFEIIQRKQFVHDLELLTAVKQFSDEIYDKLKSPLYKEQFSRFRYLFSEQESALARAEHEVMIHTPLANDKVISPREFFDIKADQQQKRAVYYATLQQQLSQWQQDLVNNRLELVRYRQQQQQGVSDAGLAVVKAPVSGIIQGIHTRYTGSRLLAEEVVCTVSPEEGLVAECYVSTKDIGMIAAAQPVLYQLDAFNHHHFGVAKGKVIAIDNDYTLIDHQPFFKVRCSVDSRTLPLRNGYRATMKKGLSFQARFKIARRSLWQLLFDDLNNWLNPASP